VAKATGGAAGDDRRRSVFRCRHLALTEAIATPDPPDICRNSYPGGTRTPSSGRNPRTSTGSTRRFIQRAVSYPLMRLQSSRSKLDESHRPKAGDSCRTVHPTEVRSNARPRHQIRRVTPFPTERSNRSDVQRAACLLPCPKAQQKGKPPAARVQRHLPWGSVPFDEISHGDRWHAGLPHRRHPLSGFLTLSAV
jgi:hypothetical protein